MFEDAQALTEEYDGSKPKISIIGVGGGGCNTVSRIRRMGIAPGIPLIAANTDKKHLNIMPDGIRKMLLGKTVTKGLGAGGSPEVAEKAALHSKAEIKREVEGVDLLFLVSGMGGGTGTGASPVIAEIARENGAIVTAFVTYPFKLERARLAKARKGIDALKKAADTVVIIDNNRLVDYAPNVAIDKAFGIADEVVGNAVKGIAETIMLESLINLDFADVKSVLEKGGVGMISIGEATGVDRVEGVISTTLSNRLLNVDTAGAKGALIHITGGPDLTIGDANEVGSRLSEKVPEDASVILGARMRDDFRGRLEAMAIFTGLKEKYTLG